jgi:glyoxylase I family protein
MVTGIEHTAIASPDPLRLAQWYVDHLDFAINYQPPNSRTVFVKAADGSRLEIIESNAAPRPAQAMRDPGLRHLAIAVTDFDAVRSRLEARGISFLTAPETVAGNTIVFFADCDGNLLHLLHRETPLP